MCLQIFFELSANRYCDFHHFKYPSKSSNIFPFYYNFTLRVGGLRCIILHCMCICKSYPKDVCSWKHSICSQVKDPLLLFWQQIHHREQTEKVNLLISCGNYKLWPRQPLLKVADLIEWMKYPPNTSKWAMIYLLEIHVDYIYLFDCCLTQDRQSECCASLYEDHTFTSHGITRKH